MAELLHIIYHCHLKRKTVIAISCSIYGRGEQNSCCFYQICGVLASCSLKAGMHSKLRQTDIYCIERYLVAGNIAQSRAAQHVRPVMEGLERNLCLLADCLEESAGNCICGVLLVCAVFDNNTLI